MPQNNLKIAVIGAGLGGLAAALALTRAGFQVTVYEQAPVLAEVGAGISVSPGSAHGLASLGLGPALLEASLPVPDVAFAHYRTGALLAGSFSPGRPPDRGLETARHIHRADLHAILLNGLLAANPDAVETDRRLTEVSQDADGVTARFAKGDDVHADLLIAADGSRSAVRRQLFGDGEPQFSGQMAFRTLIPAEAAAPYMKNGAVVSVGPSRMFHRYWIRNGELVNVIGIIKSDQWREEGWNTPASIEEFTEAFSDFHPDVLGLIRQSPADTLIKWGLFVRPPVTNWIQDRIVLLGDAAHPILPFLGLGAALAMEDGVVLARAMTATPDLGRALNAWQAARLDRVESVRINTIRQGEAIQDQDPDRIDLTKSPSQNTPLFDYDPCTVPIHV